MEAEFNLYEELFHVAIDTYKEIIKLENKLKELQVNTSKSEKSSDDFVDKVAEKNDRIRLSKNPFCQRPITDHRLPPTP